MSVPALVMITMREWVIGSLLVGVERKGVIQSITCACIGHNGSHISKIHVDQTRLDNDLGYTHHTLSQPTWCIGQQYCRKDMVSEVTRNGGRRMLRMRKIDRSMSNRRGSHWAVGQLLLNCSCIYLVSVCRQQQEKHRWEVCFQAQSATVCR